jgi:hypothetical protein
MSKLLTVSLFAGLLALSACGPGRTAAATQPTPANFDPTASDPEALAVVDAMLAELGGAETWAGVKQIQWDDKYTMDGQLKAWVRHSWDIWNGRHRCELADMSTMVAPSEENPSPDPPTFSIAMYDLFDAHSTSGHATYGGKAVDSNARQKIKANCYNLWQQQSYQLAGIYKLKDPGVKLEHVGQMKDVATKTGATVCTPACDSIKVTFAPEVGKDTYWVHVNTQSKLPELVEKQVEGGRLTYVLSDWTTVGGLKFAQKHQNAGLPGEVFTMSQIKIGAPDDSLYIPQVR